MKNPAVYFEIPVTDLERATHFYEKVFGYTFVREEIHGNQMAHLPFHDKSRGISGSLAKGKTYAPSEQGTLIYLASSDIEDTLKRAQALGSDILFPKTAVGSLGFVAEIKDSEGNRIGLHQELVRA